MGHMRTWLLVCAAAAGVVCLWLFGAAASTSAEEQLARYRNLGKAFYENPTTQKEAVEEFGKALKLAPKSTREQLNYGLALLRAGRTSEGVAQLEKVQKSDPKLPHTWFNLGIVYKKQGESEKAVTQFEQMLKLVPDEPISHYNLGTLYKVEGKTAQAIEQFQTASRLDPNLAAPHFQLYNLYRANGRQDEALRQLEVFQRMKKAAEGAAIGEDVEWSAYAEIYDITGDNAASDPSPSVKFEDKPLTGGASGVLFLDTNGDGKPKLLVWSKDGVRLEPGGPISDLKNVISVAAGDFNNDGYPDLCVLTENGPHLLINVKGKFQDFAANLPKARFEQAVWLDYDHDYDLDLILLGKESKLLRNQGAAGFEDHTADFPFAKGAAIAGATFRMIADTKGMDLTVAYSDREGLLYRDKLGGRYEAQALPLPAGARFLKAVDVDNDGWFDLVFAHSGHVSLLHNGHESWSQPSEIAPSANGFLTADTQNRGMQDIIVGSSILLNAGTAKFESPKTGPGLPGCESGEAVDADGDGRIDLACIASGQVHVVTNRTTAKNNWIRVKLAGIKNLKLATASEVEVKAGSRYQKLMYTGLPLSFGVGLEKDIDTVRITWPNGLIQNEMKQPAGKQAVYQEAQRLSGSCPIVWTWNGRGFEYITDVLGVAPLGASSGDGKYFPVDHSEYIQIPGTALEQKNGKYEVRITEELSEVAYLDHIRLIAVDHPADMDVYTNEKFKGPPFPEFRLFGVTRKFRPVAAIDDSGRDVVAKVLARDRIYPDAFARTSSGVAQEHNLDIDFGPEAARSNRSVLVLNGWVDWADGSTFLSAAQEGKGGLVTPYLQVKDVSGQWKTVIEDMGMPAGKPKTIAVDLTGKFLSASRAIRLVTNLCVYWDEIFLSEETGSPAVIQTVLAQSAADLHFRGFSPARIHPERKQPEEFSYDNAKPVSLWNPTPGLYTRYGDVRELTQSIDDKLVVMGSGDELRLQFNTTALKPLSAGWTRDFLLLVEGWAKDRDANTAYSQSTEPLPFHAMSEFPYPTTEHFPDDPAHQAYRRDYNTRPGLRLIRPLMQKHY
jgi:Tfp pilus assembly protein PilF